MEGGSLNNEEIERLGQTFMLLEQRMGEMKKAFAQVVKAQKEAQAALERARGETAALRSLANAARIMDDNPNLLQLRALQALADSSGNTLVLGLPNNAVPLPRQSEKNVIPSRKEKEEE